MCHWGLTPLAQHGSQREKDRVRSQISHQYFSGERALFFGHELDIVDAVFADGESPLKHASDVSLDRVSFEWKYPLWYSRDITGQRTTLLETARSGIWYADGVDFTDSLIAAPKTFRRSRRIRLTRTDLPTAQETLWDCDDIELTDVTAHGDYFAINSRGITAKQLRLTGNYAFDGASDVVVDDALILSKDAFWNCHNVVVRHSTIIGEYLGWNSTGVTFEDCTIESLQGLCYIDGLTMRACRLLNTTLAFEYSQVDAEIEGAVDSIINPAGGIIRCGSVGQLTLDPKRIDPAKVQVVTDVDSVA